MASFVLPLSRFVIEINEVDSKCETIRQAHNAHIAIAVAIAIAIALVREAAALENVRSRWRTIEQKFDEMMLLAAELTLSGAASLIMRVSQAFV